MTEGCTHYLKKKTLLHVENFIVFTEKWLTVTFNVVCHFSLSFFTGKWQTVTVNVICLKTKLYKAPSSLTGWKLGAGECERLRENSFSAPFFLAIVLMTLQTVIKSSSSVSLNLQLRLLFRSNKCHVQWPTLTKSILFYFFSSPVIPSKGKGKVKHEPT